MKGSRQRLTPKGLRTTEREGGKKTAAREDEAESRGGSQAEEGSTDRRTHTQG